MFWTFIVTINLRENWNKTRAENAQCACIIYADFMATTWYCFGHPNSNDRWISTKWWNLVECALRYYDVYYLLFEYTSCDAYSQFMNIHCVLLLFCPWTDENIHFTSWTGQYLCSVLSDVSYILQCDETYEIVRRINHFTLNRVFRHCFTHADRDSSYELMQVAYQLSHQSVLGLVPPKMNRFQFRSRFHCK